MKVGKYLVGMICILFISSLIISNQNYNSDIEEINLSQVEKVEELLSFKPRTLSMDYRWEISLPFECSGLAVYDFDQNGLTEIITGYNFGTMDDIGKHNKMYFIDSITGQIIRNKTLFDLTSIQNIIKVCDLDLDGLPEIIVVDLYYIFCLDYLGNLLWEFVHDSIDKICIADLNKDDYLEIIGYDHDYLFVLDYQGNLVWDRLSNYPIYDLSVADINLDGHLNIIITKRLHASDFYFTNYDHNGNIIWDKVASHNTRRFIITDIHSNPGLEILQSGVNLYCYDKNCNLLWISDDGPTGSPVICDIDNNGVAEIVAHDYAVIGCYDKLGNILRTFNLNSHFADPIIVDLNNDGYCEFIGTSNSENHITIKDYQGNTLCTSPNMEIDRLENILTYDVDIDGSLEIVYLIAPDAARYSLIYCLDIFGISDFGILPRASPDGLNHDTGTSDSDGDLLDDTTEALYHTDKYNFDSDQDGMPDGIELFYGLDPLINNSIMDKDGDSIVDLQELSIHHTYYYDADSDNDLLSDSEELFVHFTDPLNSDTDFDDLSDYAEIVIHTTDPLNYDTDGDLAGDGWELLYGFNPFLNDSYVDHDNDTLLAWEESNAGSNPYLNDSDNDMLTDAEEYLLYGTDPMNNNTDDDLMDDYWEVTWGTNPLKDDNLGDPDMDFLKNFEEYDYGTDPLNPDTDGDSFLDGYEIKKGTDPLNASSYPTEPTTPLPTNTTINISIPVQSIILMLGMGFGIIAFSRKSKWKNK